MGLLLDVQSLQVKLISSDNSFNQIYKRCVDKYIVYLIFFEFIF